MVEMVMKIKSRIPSRIKGFIRTSAYNGVATVIKIIAGVISNKVSSVFLGPAGYAILGQMSNFNSITGVLANFGFGKGVVKYIAEYYDKPEERIKIIETYLFVTLASSGIVGVAVIASGSFLSNLLFQTPDYSLIIILSALFLSFGAIGSLISNLLNGLKQYKRLITTGIITVLINLAISVPLIIMFNVFGALLSVFIVNPIATYINFSFLKKTGFEFKLVRPRFHRDSFRKLFKFTVMTLTSMTLLPLSQLVIRNYIITKISIDSAGHWQGIMKFSNMYLSVIFASISLYYVPRLSEIKDKIELRKEILAAYAVLVPLSIAMIAVILLTRDFIIDYLYAPSFRPMRELFLFQMFGDFFRVVSYVLSHLFIAKALGKLFVISEITSISMFLILSFILAGSFGVVGITYAYAINYFLYLIFVFFALKNYLFIK